MTAAVDEQLVINQPGLYLDLPSEVYHGDPIPGGSLSSTGARRIVPPGCPALFHHDRTHPAEPKPIFELGHAAHAVVLGTGPEIIDMGPDDWRTNAIKAKVAEARERGAVPLKTPAYEAVHAMSAALREHAIAGPLLTMQGTAEGSIFWQDRGIWRRARLDWLCSYVVDYKTAESAEPTAVEKAMARYGLHQQADYYLDAARSIGRDPAGFLLIVQEKTAPYLVTVAQPDHNALEVGRRQNRIAMDLYREATATGRWPGYALPYADSDTNSEVAYLALPPWVEALFLKESR